MTEKTIGIRREDKNIWETRAPITPEDVSHLRREYAITTVVQPSATRVFQDEDYARAGAVLDEALDVPFIFGIKEIPVQCFQNDKTYIFFSHTIKGQAYNMPMLRRILALKDTLLDYEKITDGSGRRLIAFGKFAGIAGMIDTLWALGKRWEWEGKITPFARVKRAYQYSELKTFQSEAAAIGRDLVQGGIPGDLSPIVIGITGYGNVAGGVQEVLSSLPVQEIAPAELAGFKGKNDAIYKVVFREQDMVERTDGATFDIDDYYRRPENYRPVFERYLPYLTVLVNCIYWEKKYPRLLTRKWLGENHGRSARLKVIGDLSCDVAGAIEINAKVTAPDNPVYCYDPESGEIAMGYKGKGPVVLAVDILPTQLPREASVYFSERLRQFVPEIVGARYPANFNDCTLPDHLKKAVIAYKGTLTPLYGYLEDYLA